MNSWSWELKYNGAILAVCFRITKNGNSFPFCVIFTGSWVFKSSKKLF